MLVSCELSQPWSWSGEARHTSRHINTPRYKTLFYDLHYSAHSVYSSGERAESRSAVGIMKMRASQRKLSAQTTLEGPGLPEVYECKFLFHSSNLICHPLLWLAKFAKLPLLWRWNWTLYICFWKILFVVWNQLVSSLKIPPLCFINKQTFNKITPGSVGSDFSKRTKLGPVRGWGSTVPNVSVLWKVFLLL